MISIRSESDRIEIQLKLSPGPSPQGSLGRADGRPSDGRAGGGRADGRTGGRTGGRAGADGRTGGRADGKGSPVVSAPVKIKLDIDPV